jgi:hypothetical protein
MSRPLSTAFGAVFALGLALSAAADNADFKQTGMQPVAQTPTPTGPSLQGGGADFGQQSKGNGEFKNNEFTRTNPNVDLEEVAPPPPPSMPRSAAPMPRGDSKSKTVVTVHSPDEDAHPDEDATTFEGGVAKDDDVRENFVTVVQDYVARKSAKDGSWAYREKNGKSWRLKSVAVAAAPVKKSGEGRWTGAATLRDAKTGHRLTLDFTVDFTGNWKVVSVKPHAKS